MESNRNVNIPFLICVSSMSHIQLPLCKLSFLWIISKSHVCSKMQDFEIIPYSGVLNASSNHLWSGSFHNDRKDLLKVTSKHHSKTTKGFITFTNILQSAIYSFLCMSML